MHGRVVLSDPHDDRATRNSLPRNPGRPGDHGRAVALLLQVVHGGQRLRTPSIQHIGVVGRHGRPHGWHGLVECQRVCRQIAAVRRAVPAHIEQQRQRPRRDVIEPGILRAQHASPSFLEELLGNKGLWIEQGPDQAASGLSGLDDVRTCRKGAATDRVPLAIAHVRELCVTLEHRDLGVVALEQIYQLPNEHRIALVGDEVPHRLAGLDVKDGAL